MMMMMMMMMMMIVVMMMMMMIVVMIMMMMTMMMMMMTMMTMMMMMMIMITMMTTMIMLVVVVMMVIVMMIMIVMISDDHINNNLTVFCCAYLMHITFAWGSFARTCRHCHVIKCVLLKTMYLYGIIPPVWFCSALNISRFNFNDSHSILLDPSSTVLLGDGPPSYANAGGTVVCCGLYFRRLAWNWVINRLNP